MECTQVVAEYKRAAEQLTVAHILEMAVGTHRAAVGGTQRVD